MAVFTTYDAVGIKEDVSDIITNISPTKTPFQSAIGREKITQPIFQWQEDALRATAVNAQAEGFDATAISLAGNTGFDTVAPTAMRSNNTQIFAEAIQVSGTMEATSTYGRARESAYQLAKAAAAVKRDLEVALVGAKTSASLAAASAGTAGAGTGGVDGTARTMASYPSLIQANPLTVNAATLGVTGQNVTYSAFGTNYTSTGPAGYGAGAVAGAAITSTTDLIAQAAGTGNGPGLTEGALLQSLENCYNNGAEPDCIYVTPANAWNLANFAKAAGRYRQIQDNGAGSAKQVVNAVDLYVSPYGEIKVYIDRFLSGRSTLVPTPGNDWTLVVDPSMWSLATLRPWFREVLAKTGDSIKQMIVGEFSLKVKNRFASSMVVDTGSATTAIGTGGVF